MAAAGQEDEARKICDELVASSPKDTILNRLWVPAINATILLHNGRAKETIEELEITERLEKAADFFPQYIRGLAFQRLGRDREAIREFDKILNNRGEAPLSSLYPVAQLAKARMTNNKADYEKFFELWKDADKDMPALVAAKSEYEALA